MAQNSDVKHFVLLYRKDNKKKGRLEDLKLVEVKYDELKGKPYDDKTPKSYKFLRLYDPKDLELRLKGIEEKIKKAFDIVALKNTDNPEKSYGYVVGIIENR